MPGTLQEALLGLFNGTLTYVALEWLLKEIESWGVVLSSKQKRLAAYVLSFLISFGALFAAARLGYAELTPDSLFVAFLAAFGASQAIHGGKDL